MARVGYCRHGTYIGQGRGTDPRPSMKITNAEGVEVEVQIPGPSCWECEREERARKDAQEYKQAAELNMVKQNFLRLLKEDEAFANEVRKLLKVVVKNSARTVSETFVEKHL